MNTIQNLTRNNTPANAAAGVNGGAAGGANTHTPHVSMTMMLFNFRFYFVKNNVINKYEKMIIDKKCYFTIRNTSNEYNTK